MILGSSHLSKTATKNITIRLHRLARERSALASQPATIPPLSCAVRPCSPVVRSGGHLFSGPNSDWSELGRGFRAACRNSASYILPIRRAYSGNLRPTLIVDPLAQSCTMYEFSCRRKATKNGPLCCFLSSGLAPRASSTSGVVVADLVSQRPALDLTDAESIIGVDANHCRCHAQGLGRTGEAHHRSEFRVCSRSKT